MSLNDLRLSPSVIAALYPSSLIQSDKINVAAQKHIFIKPENTIEDNPAELKWKSLGGNKQNILIVVQYNDAVHLPDEEINFLTNMLTACKLSLGDVTIVNTRNYKETFYKDILTYFNSKIVFLFGVEPAEFGLPVSFPYFQVQEVANSTFLYTPALEDRHKDPLLKSKFWVSLRGIFGI